MSDEKPRARHPRARHPRARHPRARVCKISVYRYLPTMTIQPPALHSFIAHALQGVCPIFAVSSGGGSSKKRARSAASTAKKPKRHNKTPAASVPTRTSPRFHPSTNQSEAASQEQRLGSARKTLDLSHHEGNISSSHNSEEEESNDNVTNTEPPPLPPPAPATAVNSEVSLENGAEDIFSTDNVVDQHDCLFDSAAVDFSFEDRIRHFMGSMKINEKNRNSVEAAILIEAGSITYSESTGNAQDKYNMIASKYKDAIESLDSDLFSSDKIRSDMFTRLKGGRANNNTGAPASFKGKTMWTKYEALRRTLRKVFSNLGQNYHKLGSGVQLHQMNQQIIRQQFRLVYVSLFICCSNSII